MKEKHPNLIKFVNDMDELIVKLETRACPLNEESRLKWLNDPLKEEKIVNSL